ncbi:CU044_2847 family protein [Plantactinospora solaniradicis]|uniref:CU044_2847 family protein n=1 Tax=Plantactinospora solaniradicis TaxID=1723736 RepID=A0ABW1KBZ6_9ACTN
MSPAPVRVEVFAPDDDFRQIGPSRRVTTLLRERTDEIGTAVREISTMLRNAVADESTDRPADDGWQISTVTSTFGLSLATTGGVVVTKASAEVSFEVTLTIERA